MMVIAPNGDRIPVSTLAYLADSQAQPSFAIPALEVMEDFFDLLAESVDLENVANRVLEFVTLALGRPGGALIVQPPGEVSPKLVIQHGLDPAWGEALADPGSDLNHLAHSILLQKGQPVAVDQEQDLDIADLAAVLPIEGKSGLQGVLFLKGQRCTAQEIAWLARLSRPLGREILRLHPLPVIGNSPQGLEVLKLAVITLSSSTDFEGTQVQIIQGICSMVEAEGAALILVDEEQSGLITKSYMPHGAAGWLYQANLKLEAGLLWECLRSGQLSRVNNIDSEARFLPAFDGVFEMDVRSTLCAPLVVNGIVLGAIQVFNPRTGGFTPDHEELLGLIASLAAHSIYSRRLIEQLKIVNADLEASHWELLRSRNTLRALFDSMPAALYIVDRSYRLMAINLSCAQRAGHPPQALVGRPCYEALYDRKAPCEGCQVMKTLQSGENTSRTERRWNTAEEPVDWEISSYPILDETEQVVQAILLEEDVTERQRLESILAQSEKLAAVGQLAAGVAHEINNPLTAIIANAQLLQRDLPPDDENQESIELIIRAGARATQVVRNLLDFARKEQYHMAPTDVNETLQRSLAMVQHEVLARAIRLNFDPAPDLPLVHASQDHLQGVWLNLIMNAIDAMEEGQGELRVTTRCVGDEIRTTIADNGKGIPPERLTRIFEPFYTTKAPGRGTGLGLSVCHRVIKQHGGHILVESRVGAGTEFTVVLPIL